MSGPKSFSISGGRVTGQGTITGNVSIGAATVAPGLPAGTLVVTGTYKQNAKSVLEIEIAGSNPGEFDVLEVSSTATLAGELLVLEDADFTPEPGNIFVILTAGIIVGQFDTVTLPPPYEIRYKDQDVRLIVPLPGDLDENGFANLYDWYLFTLCFNGSDNPPALTCSPDVDADLDNDGDVDFDDVRIIVAATEN